MAKDDANIIPLYSTSGVQELVSGMPFDQTSKLEALKYLHECSVDTEDYFRGAPN
jgi:hypothetical protein